MQYPVNEVFETIQGEGVFTGVPAIFVRLQGCPVGCPWCDTRHTWYLSQSQVVSVDELLQIPSGQAVYTPLSAEQLLQLFAEQGWHSRHVVITGGEPCFYDLLPLTAALEAADYRCQIETSGTFAISCSAQSFVTVSPKIKMRGGYRVRKDALQRANEIKHPIAMQKHIDELDELLQDIDLTGKSIALQPISQQPRATELAMKTAIARNWRLSIQMHKYLGID